jgi:folate-dependent phosphoribosylglycinamide formyltransferase PurN
VRIFIVASDEPIFLVPYVRRVIAECRQAIVGVGVHVPQRKRVPLRRLVATLLLGLIMSSPRQWLRLVGWKARDLAASLGVAATRHHLADVCRDAGVPWYRIDSVNTDSTIALLREHRVDVLLHQTPEILQGEVLRTPAVGVLNRHMSLLPAYRGAWPLYWQLANGEREVGISLHLVDEGIDSGAVVVQEAVTRQPGESAASLMARLFDRSVPLTCTALQRLSTGKPPAQPMAEGRIYRTPHPLDVLGFMFRRQMFRVSSAR